MRMNIKGSLQTASASVHLDHPGIIILLPEATSCFGDFRATVGDAGHLKRRSQTEVRSGSRLHPRRRSDRSCVIGRRCRQMPAICSSGGRHHLLFTTRARSASNRLGSCRAEVRCADVLNSSALTGIPYSFLPTHTYAQSLDDDSCGLLLPVINVNVYRNPYTPSSRPPHPPENPCQSLLQCPCRAPSTLPNDELNQGTGPDCCYMLQQMH